MSTVRARSPAFIQIASNPAVAGYPRSGPGAHDPVHVDNRANTRQTERLRCETPTPGNAPKYLKNPTTSADGTVDDLVTAEVRGTKVEEAARITSSLFDRPVWRAAGIQAENPGDRCVARSSRPISTTSSSTRKSHPGTNDGQRKWSRNRTCVLGDDGDGVEIVLVGTVHGRPGSQGDSRARKASDVRTRP